MILGMVDTSTLEGVLRASQPSRRQPRPTPQPVQPTQNSRLNEVARVALGMNPFTGTSQADRDAATGFIQRHGALDALLAPASSLVEDFADAGYAPSSAAGRFGLGAAAFGADVLNPVGWAVGAPIDKTIGTGLRFARRIPGTFQPETAYYSSLLRRIIDDPNTALTTVRSMDSAGDIIGGSGVFRSSNTLGTSGSQPGGATPELYDRLRNTFESNINLGDDVAYGALTSPVLRNQPAPLPLGSRGRQNYLTYQNVASLFDPYGTARSYGALGGRTPVRYILDRDVLNRSGVSFGDSLRGAPSFTSYDDFVAALNRGGYDEIMSTPGNADWGWIRRNNTLNFPEYIEAQIPNLTIDDVTSVVGMGQQPLDAAQSAMELSDLIAASGRDLPVGALSNVVPREVSAGTTQTKEVVDALRSNPRYEEIIDSLRAQRGDFVLPGGPDVLYRYNNMGNTAYGAPDWAVGHRLRQMGEDTGQYSPSAVVNYLQNVMNTQVNPRLRAFQRALFPEVGVPTTKPLGAFDDL